MKEKYLKLSDFVEFIIRSKSLLMKQIYLEKSKLKKDNELLGDFMMKFLINCQDVIDIDQCVRHMIYMGHSDILIDNLNKYSKEKSNIKESKIAVSTEAKIAQLEAQGSQNFSGQQTDSAESYVSSMFSPRQKRMQFLPENKKKMLISLFKNSVKLQLYDVTFEIIRVFMQDLLNL